MTRRNIKGWKVKPVEHELPSGAVVEIRRVPMSVFLARGEVPQFFFQSLQEGAPADATAPKIERRPGTVGYKPEAEQVVSIDPSKLQGQELKDFYAFARAVARASLVWPKVVDHPSEAEDEVTVEQIPDADLLAIFTFAISDAPVATTTGEVPAEAVRKIPEDGDLQGGGVGVQDVSQAPG